MTSDETRAQGNSKFYTTIAENGHNFAKNGYIFAKYVHRFPCRSASMVLTGICTTQVTAIGTLRRGASMKDIRDTASKHGCTLFVGGRRAVPIGTCSIVLDTVQPKAKATRMHAFGLAPS
jgi:hypothetical protein